MVDLLECTVMPYAWGSRTAIAELSGRASPAAGPEAELWMGAHPMAPSRLARQGVSRSLGEVIADSAEHELGTEVVAAFGARLPFLLKVLAAREPLSLQAHPTEAQARAGFEEEDGRGVPRDAPNRNYRDRSHKPELLCALTAFDALCGFRKISDTLRLFDDLRVAELDEVLANLRRSPDSHGLKETVRAIMALSGPSGARLVTATVAACKASAARDGGRSPNVPPELARARAWAMQLESLYPGDVGIIIALLLNVVHLEPGEAIYLEAGNLHAYLDGVGVEIMASSDNVLRGGLTKKHVDVPELMRVLDFADGPIAAQRALPLDAHERVYETSAREFRLSTIDLEASAVISRDVRGPEILLCTEGNLRIAPGDGSSDVVLVRGGAVFVPASTARYTLRASSVTDQGTGRASLYRATVNLT